jgi:hypothetical protein
MTPDDEAKLRELFVYTDDENYEKNLTPQARPNVLFEAGMAMARAPKRTVLVQLGKLRPFSDIGGRHVIKLNNTSQKRQELAQRLQKAGFDVNFVDTDWHSVGDFDGAIKSLSQKAKRPQGLSHPQRSLGRDQTTPAKVRHPSPAGVPPKAR